MATACTNGLDTGFVDLGYAKVAVLGVVQGITELLPISSTAHMKIVPSILGWRDPGTAFSAAMQAAALAAVISYFWSDVRALVVGSTRAVARRDFADRHFRMAMYIALATAPLVIGGLLISKTLNACDTPLRSLEVIGVASLTMALLMGIAETYCRHTRQYDEFTLKDAMIVGVAQVGALIPGVSRSGSTLTAALFRDFKREDAAKFSFLLGLPAIAGAGLKEFYILYKAGIGAYAWSVLGLGLVVASLSAFVAIWGLLRILERFSSWPFVVYRGLMGVFLIYAGLTGWLR